MSRIPTQSTDYTKYEQGLSIRPGYGTYKSKFAPKYSIEPNYHGWSASRFLKYTPMLAGFSVATGLFALYFFAEVPRVRKDIVEKIPIIGPYFHKEIPPEDNPF